MCRFEDLHILDSDSHLSNNGGLRFFSKHKCLKSVTVRVSDGG